MLKATVVTLLVVLLCSCVTVLPPSRPSSPYDVKWPDNEGGTHNVEVGNAIIESGRLNYYDGLILGEPVVMRYGREGITLPEGEYAHIFSASGRNFYFPAQKLNSTSGLMFNPDDPESLKGFLIINNSWVGMALIRKPVTPLRIAKVPDYQNIGFKQELVYAGRSGNNVKFIYREYNDQYIRAPFAQEVQYDISDPSNTVFGFKGARLQILDATNTTLRFNLLENFPTLKEQSIGTGIDRLRPVN